MRKLKENYGYEQALELAKQLPIEDLKKLKEEIENDIQIKLQLLRKGKIIQFGDMKGLITYIADDFDAPLEFKD